MTTRQDPTRDWSSELAKADALIARLRPLVVDIAAAGFTDGAAGGKLERRLELVIAALERVRARANRELAKRTARVGASEASDV